MSDLTLHGNCWCTLSLVHNGDLQGDDTFSSRPDGLGNQHASHSHRVDLLLTIRLRAVGCSLHALITFAVSHNAKLRRPNRSNSTFESRPREKVPVVLSIKVISSVPRNAGVGCGHVLKPSNPRRPGACSM